MHISVTKKTKQWKMYDNQSWWSNSGSFWGEKIDKLTFCELWKSPNGASQRQIALFISIVILQLITFLHVLLCPPPVPWMEISALYQHPAEIYNDAKKERSFAVKLSAAKHNGEPNPTIINSLKLSMIICVFTLPCGFAQQKKTKNICKADLEPWGHHLDLVCFEITPERCYSSSLPAKSFLRLVKNPISLWLETL